MSDAPTSKAFWLHAGIPICALLLLYLGLMRWSTGELRADEILIALFIVAMLFVNERTRDFTLRTLPLALYGIVYDLTHLTEPLVHKLHVRVAGPYHLELALFGLSTPTGRITANQFFAEHHSALVDFATGSAYLLFLYWALIFGFYLVLTGRSGERRRLATIFTWTFFAMNVAGFATYYIVPTAPPWYVAQYGLGPANFAAVASPAAAIRWDELTGIHYFKNFYSQSADIFGAMPSLHAAQPCLVFLYGLHLRRLWLNIVQGGFYLLVCLSAVYLQHHYLIDVLAGSLYALAAYAAGRAWSAWAHSRNPSVPELPVESLRHLQPATK